jgi:hypothetical protein
MIYEMRTYTMYPGKMPAYLKAADTIPSGLQTLPMGDICQASREAAPLDLSPVSNVRQHSL